jgi:hypothetical protein
LQALASCVALVSGSLRLAISCGGVQGTADICAGMRAQLVPRHTHNARQQPRLSLHQPLPARAAGTPSPLALCSQTPVQGGDSPPPAPWSPCPPCPSWACQSQRRCLRCG